jgi:hypothetical protein
MPDYISEPTGVSGVTCITSWAVKVLWYSECTAGRRTHRGFLPLIEELGTRYRSLVPDLRVTRAATSPSQVTSRRRSPIVQGGGEVPVSRGS